MSMPKPDSTECQKLFEFHFFLNFLFTVLGIKPWSGCMLCCALNPEKIEINSAIIFIYMFYTIYLYVCIHVCINTYV